MMTAASLAPNAMGLQNYIVVAINDKEIKNKIADEAAMIGMD